MPQHNTNPFQKSLTNVNVRLGTLENRSQPTGSQTVLGENMLHRVDGARPQQGRPAGARKQIGGSGNARHPDDQQVTKQHNTEEHNRGQTDRHSLERKDRSRDGANFRSAADSALGPIRIAE